MIIFYIGIAGALGAMVRFGISLAWNPQEVLAMPWGTLLVNVTGCFLISVLLSNVRLSANPRLRASLTTGFVGSFTTMSTLSVELLLLLEHERWLTALVYFAGSLWGGLGMIRLGKSINL